MIGRLIKHPMRVCLVVFLIVLASREYVVRLEVENARDVVTSRALAEASTIRATIESELNSTIYLGIGLAAFLSLSPEPGEQAAMQLLDTVFEQGKNIRNISLAPDNRITYIYPMAGNEAALGLHFKDLPAQWPGVQRAMGERKTIAIGPIALVQGGYGIVTRTPVYLSDDSYWGIISTVVDVDGLLESVASSHSGLGVKWSIRAELPDEREEQYLFGDAAHFSTDGIREPVVLPGGRWEIAVAPAEDWKRGIFQMQVIRRTASAVVAFLIALLVYLVLRERVQIHYMADHDTLTDLPNRRLLLERLEQRIALAARYKTSFFLVYVDLDQFKPVNDHYGHRCGDLVLCEIGQRMVSVVRGSDTVARVGGDEFVVLLPDTEEVAGARAVTRNLRQAIARPIDTDKGTLVVGASLGISCYPTDGTTPEALLGFADAAMYSEKTTDRGDPSKSTAGEGAGG